MTAIHAGLDRFLNKENTNYTMFTDRVFNTLEKVTSFPHKNCYGFFVVFIWFTIEIPSWKKCLFSTLENLQFPVWNFNFPNMENNFYSNLEKHGKFKIQEWF